MSTGNGIRISLLGQLLVDGVPWTITSRKWRRILAALALSPGEVVTYQVLAEAVFADAPPKDPQAALRKAVDRIQGKFGENGPHILNQPGVGYWIDLAPGQVDVPVFLGRCNEGRELTRSGQHKKAVQILTEALLLRRSVPLYDIDSPALEAEWSEHLDHLWAQARKDRARNGVHLGRHENFTAELKQLTAEHSIDEELWALLMLALYRSGRRADALAAYLAARRVLRAELNVAPDPVLAVLHHQIRTRVPADRIPVP